MNRSLRRDFVAGALAVGLIGGALAGSASSAAQPPVPPKAEHAHPAQGQPPPERGSREDREQISDSAQELGIQDPVYGMPADEHGNPAAPTTHRGDPASGEYGTSRQRCVGDGVSGERMRVFYGYPSTVTSNYNTDTVNYIRAKLGYANYYLYDSNATYGQDIRWQCNTSGLIQVTQLPLYNTDTSDPRDISIDEMEASIRKLNLSVCRYGCTTHQPYSYVVMADKTLWGSGTSANYCGLGWPGADATNNKNTKDRRSGVVSDVRCWTGHVILHEIIHTQGAVFRSAPNSDGGHHCWGTNDLMCSGYPDGNNPCPNSGSEKVDCGHNHAGGDTNGVPGEPIGERSKEDYWDPTGGHYFLSTNWNTADSLWFTRPALK